MPAVPDSAAFARLDTMLMRYSAAIERESIDVKKAESDFLISSVKDSLTTRHIALWLYDHYKDSPVMGEEAVAIHIYDTWHGDGERKLLDLCKDLPFPVTVMHDGDELFL